LRYLQRHCGGNCRRFGEIGQQLASYVEIPMLDQHRQTGRSQRSADHHQPVGSCLRQLKGRCYQRASPQFGLFKQHAGRQRRARVFGGRHSQCGARPLTHRVLPHPTGVAVERSCAPVTVLTGSHRHHQCRSQLTGTANPRISGQKRAGRTGWRIDRAECILPSLAQRRDRCANGAPEARQVFIVRAVGQEGSDNYKKNEGYKRCQQHARRQKVGKLDARCPPETLVCNSVLVDNQKQNSDKKEKEQSGCLGQA
jgi:hypothetical protein